MSLPETPLALVADIGATNARFALLRDGEESDRQILPCASFPSLAAAIGNFLDRINPPRPPRRAAIAVPCPVVSDRVSFTNLPWSFSIRELREQLALDRLEVINDFTAVALSLPYLQAEDFRQIGGGTAVDGEAIGVLGPGTGLGVSGLIPVAGRWRAISAEGGHVTLPGTTAREDAVIAYLRTRFAHVSAERTLSGAGLVNLYDALCAIDQVPEPTPRDPAAITEAALADRDPYCAEAVEMFCALLGTVAGNLALTLGARGGLFIAGGIVPRFGPWFDRSAFRARFEAKGRLGPYVAAMPSYLITNPMPAFIGLRSLVET